MTSLGGQRQLLLVFFLLETISTVDLTCPASVPTVKEVSSCPATLEALKNAVKRKNCESISTLQNCTKPSNFRYHCVLQMDLSKLVEVCASSIRSQGKCVGYDTVGKRIQQMEDRSCQDYTNPCPIGFLSWNSTAYADCYMLLKKLGDTTKRTADSPKKDIWIIIAILLFAVLLFVIVFWVFVTIRRRRTMKQKEGNHDGKEKETQEHLVDEHLQGEEITYAEEGNETQENIVVDEHLQRQKTSAEGIYGEDITDTDVDDTDNDDVFFVIESEKTEGFDYLSFKIVLTKYELQSVEQIFKEHDIDCIQAFVKMSDDELNRLGLTIGQRKKCLSVINILNNRNKKTVSASNITNKKINYDLLRGHQSLSTII